LTGLSQNSAAILADLLPGDGITTISGKTSNTRTVSANVSPFMTVRKITPCRGKIHLQALIAAQKIQMYDWKAHKIRQSNLPFNISDGTFCPHDLLRIFLGHIQQVINSSFLTDRR